MERRSRTKVIAKENTHQQKGKNFSNGTQMQEEVPQCDRSKQLKESFLFSLANVFSETKNDPSLIYPWIKDSRQLQETVIGRNYIIQGPSQSGKYSTVKYALDQNHQNIKQILVNCDISTTESQIYEKIIEEFFNKCRKECKFSDKKQIAGIFSSQSIDLQKLNVYLIKGKVEFVIVIRNAERLFGFKNQSILYNLFDWMRSEEISKIGGLVLISRNLRLTDQFEKRVKSRFCGTRICIFRPQKAEIYIKIITKRIDAVINDKQTWLALCQLFNPQLSQGQEQLYQQDEEGNPKCRKRMKIVRKCTIQQKSTVSLQQIIRINQESVYFKSLDEYFKSLQSILSESQLKQLQIQNFFIQRAYQYQKLKTKRNFSQIYNRQSVLKPQQQIDCLKKLKQAFQKNKQLQYYLQYKVMDNQIITIPFLLMAVQHLIIRLDQVLVKTMTIAKLKKLVLILFQKSIEHQFPTHDMQGNSLESKFQLLIHVIDLNYVEIIFLTLIYQQIVASNDPVRLTGIYKKYQDKVNKEIFNKSQRSTNTLPILLIERAIRNLQKNRIITYELHNMWNSQIKLIYGMEKTKRGLQKVANQKTISEFIKNIFVQATIKPTEKPKTQNDAE